MIQYLRYDFLDEDFAELLAMTIELAIALTTLLVEDKYLVALDQRRDDFAYDLSTSHYRRTYSDSTVLIYEKDLVEFYYCATLCTLDVVNEEATALFYIELLALNVYDDVHYR